MICCHCPTLKQAQKAKQDGCHRHSSDWKLIVTVAVMVMRPTCLKSDVHLSRSRPAAAGGTQDGGGCLCQNVLDAEIQQMSRLALSNVQMGCSLAEGLTPTYEGHWSYPRLLVFLPVCKWLNEKWNINTARFKSQIADMDEGARPGSPDSFCLCCL